MSLSAVVMQHAHAFFRHLSDKSMSISTEYRLSGFISLLQSPDICGVSRNRYDAKLPESYSSPCLPSAHRNVSGFIVSICLMSLSVLFYCHFLHKPAVKMGMQAEMVETV